jgi:hypothetical protein
VHVVTAVVIWIVWSTSRAAVVAILAFADQVMLLVTLAFVRGAVALFAGVMVTDTHHRVW